MFIKRGEGKILSVIKDDEILDEKQKAAFKNASEIVSSVPSKEVVTGDNSKNTDGN